jgi:hypothetical protein
MKYTNTFFTDKHNGTSFHNGKVRTTIHALMGVLGVPSDYSNSGDDKINVEWAGMLNGIPFTVYDWKEYRVLEEDEDVTFHIGTHSPTDSQLVRNWLTNLL